MNKTRKLRTSLLLLFICLPGTQLMAEHLPLADVSWQALNPARGEAGPRAATLWGDRNSNVATGFLVRFTDGFSSPPHVHNVSYRGIVISGLIHNDDPAAASMWMPAASYWTQPKGELHITAAKGKNNLAYIEIDRGPYLVHPPEQAFDSGERPVNVDASNLVWLQMTNLPWLAQVVSPAPAKRPTIAYLWGKAQSGETGGALIRLPSASAVKLSSQATNLAVVVIAGQAEFSGPGRNSPISLEAGSFVSSVEEPEFRVESSGKAEAIIYLRTNFRD